MPDPLRACLDAGLAALGENLDDGVRARLLAFIALLAQWNRVYNLTALRDPEQMLTGHILDSVAVLPWLCGARVLDVGSGAGLPGVPLALARPAQHFTLLDSNGKKTRFLLHAKTVLGLANVEIVQARVAGYQPALKFDTLIARAFASIGDFVVAAAHLLAPGGVLLAMKGVDPGSELLDLPPGFAAETVRLAVPGLDAERHIARIVRIE